MHALSLQKNAMKYKTNTGKTLIIKNENEINRGGEGRIMLIENQQYKVAKLYHNQANNFLDTKIKYLNKLDKSVFVTPEELIYSNNALAGFTMQFVGNEYFPISTIFSKNYCNKNNITTNFKKQIAEKLISSVKNAHQNNIVIGDLNQFNVLINLKSDVKIIDTDAFETPGIKHTGVLLDDVRDYLYNGIVNRESDYFALSVMIFYMFTYTHPFKGIHKHYKSLRERMIYKLPIFASDTNLKSPNCFIPITDNFLQNQFKNIFTNGERFLISLDKAVLSTQTIQVKTKVKAVSKDNIIVNQIISGVKITDINFNKNLGFIKTNKYLTIYSAQNHGYLSRKFVLSSNEYDDVFIGYKNVVFKNKTKLFQIVEQDKIVEIKNFTFSQNAKFIQKENIIIVIDENRMFWLYVDEIINGSIKNQRFEVFGKSFLGTNGMIQNTGGVKRIFYNSGKNITSLKIDKNIKSIFQTENFGVAQFVENNEVKTKYFSIINNNINWNIIENEAIPNFTLMKLSDNEAYVFEASNQEINVLRISDFAKLSTIKCDFVDFHSEIFWSRSGIIVSNQNDVFLINSK